MPSARLQQLVHIDERWPGVKKPREATTLGSFFLLSFEQERKEGRREKSVDTKNGSPFLSQRGGGDHRGKGKSENEGNVLLKLGKNKW